MYHLVDSIVENKMMGIMLLFYGKIMDSVFIPELIESLVSMFIIHKFIHERSFFVKYKQIYMRIIYCKNNEIYRK